MKLILRKKKEFVSHFQQSVLNQRHPDWVEFIAAFFESASTQMLKDPTDKHLFIQVKRSWDFFQGHQGNNKPVIHYHVDTEHQRLCLDIIQKDQPFIIETLKNAFHYHALTSDIIFHPVFKVKRDVKGNLLHIISKESKNPADYSYESLISCEIHWKANEQEAKAIIDDIEWRLNLIHLTVDDWPKMRKIIQTSYSKKQHPESDYFDWLFHDNFLFLGLRTIETSTDKTTIRFPRTVGSLGIFKDDVLAQNKNFKGTGFKPTKKSLCFHMTKTHIRSPINRPARVDMIEFFDEQKNVTHQMIGIFTRRSYTQSNFKIPIIKTKAEHVFDQFGLRRNWHDGKMLVKALESIPHDEYWHFSQDDLYTLCDDVLSFHELSLPTYIAQLSEDKSSLTMIVFIGRDRYSMDLKKKMGDFLANHLNGQLSSVRGIIDDSPFARFIYVISAIKNSWRENGLKDVLEELSLSWNENRHKLCLKHHGTDTFIHTFDGNYQKDFTPEQALFDAGLITTTNSTHTFALNATFSKAALEKTFQSHLDLRVMRFEQSVVLSTLMDVLQNFGITVNQEKTYVLEGGRYYLHDCLGNIPQEDLSKETITRLEGSIVETLSEKSPNDPFNKLIIYADFSPKEVHLFRSYAEYMQQIKHPYGFHFIANSLVEFPGIAKSLLTLFKTRFDPHGQKRDLTKIFETFEDQLMTVESSAQDALFRDMKNMVQATLRTNFFLDRPYISLKFSCELIDALPEPKPLYEVFVSSPLMQGIHLRSSKIARGGIRYSDRPHDFRSEVLQLMQAQNLKNAIIVPTGAKGGFILKKRNPSKEDVLAAYKTLISGLLDLADNRIQGKEWHNPGSIAYDDFDPYLVVAADKGTATFSDTANNLATDYNFWLGDAFASGGSHGYDHKQLGITAKGAFVSVRHHLKKMGINPEIDSVTVVGVGDMSGDVFGNGMILHDTLKLLGAFNHKHIFVDPNPDAKASFIERQRLFNNPTLGWEDYDPTVLSKGGAIFKRSSKKITLSKEVQECFNVPETLSPNELIKAILIHKADVLWFGGIGTYIKATDETYGGDSVNDALRINASDIQAKVIGEGANLGVTPLARIELGLKGVHINSDAIDNAGGVNCSDREVNLKILTHAMPNTKRDSLLQSISNDIVHLILKDNTGQNQALDLIEESAQTQHFDYCDLIQKLERDAGLKRPTVFLDTDKNLRNQRTYLTRSEMAIILSYSKILLKRIILQNFETFEKHAPQSMQTYFPKAIVDQFGDSVMDHLLYKELIALTLTNQIISKHGVLWMKDLNFEATDNITRQHMIHAINAQLHIT